MGSLSKQKRQGKGWQAVIAHTEQAQFQR